MRFCALRAHVIIKCGKGRDPKKKKEKGGRGREAEEARNMIGLIFLIAIIKTISLSIALLISGHFFFWT
jgi:hypothetical protein